jgi:hypothetical protein
MKQLHPGFLHGSDIITVTMQKANMGKLHLEFLGYYASMTWKRLLTMLIGTSFTIF